MILFQQNFAVTSKFEHLPPPIWTPPTPQPSVADSNDSECSDRLQRTSPHQAKISPRLANLAYGLSHRVLLPNYFQHIRVDGQANLPQVGPVIFAPTHRSRWDALLVPYAVGPQVTGRYPRYMVTIDEMQGLQGWFIRRIGGFAVDTRSPGISSVRYGIDLLHQSQPLVIFPEGGNLAENQRLGLNHLHPGLARIAVKASLSRSDCDVKIVPIAINYDHSPTTARVVDIQIGSPLLVSDYLEKDGKRSAHRITRDLEGAMRQLSRLSDPVGV